MDIYYAISLSRSNDGPTPQDFLFIDYGQFFEQFSLKLIYIPNFSKQPESYFDDLNLKGLILSGGQPDPQRDAMEKKLLELAIERNLPVLGICRGMQFINLYFGGSLTPDLQILNQGNNYHIKKTHSIEFSDSAVIDLLGKKETKVNSYHQHGIQESQLAEPLKSLAVSTKDGIIEALYHSQLPIVGIQWHPERAGSSFQDDAKLIQAFIERKLYWRNTKK